VTNAKFQGDEETAKRLFSECLLRALKNRCDQLDAVQMYGRIQTRAIYKARLPIIFTMPHIIAADHVHHIFRKIARMIADPFQ
jgi:hypothetical protein